jgi:hypothetical protein
MVRVMVMVILGFVLGMNGDTTMALTRAAAIAAKRTVPVYPPVTLEPTERMIKAFVGLVNKLPRGFKIISAPGVKPVDRSRTEQYVGLRRDRGQFSQYVYKMIQKEIAANPDIPKTWGNLKPKGVCTPEAPCNDCCHCAMVACGDIAAANGLITMVNNRGTKDGQGNGRGWTTYYRLDEQTGVDEGLLDSILAEI